MTDITRGLDRNEGVQVHCGTVYPNAWIAPTAMEYESFEQQLGAFQAMHQSAPYWLGDMIIAGQHAFGEMYTQAIVLTGKSVETLEQYVWVCRSIEPARRYSPSSGVKYTHHRYVACLPPDEQDYWLAMAYRGTDGIPWSSAKLKQELLAQAPFTRHSPPRLTVQATPISAAQFIRSHFDNQWVADFIKELNHECDSNTKREI